MVRALYRDVPFIVSKNPIKNFKPVFLTGLKNIYRYFDLYKNFKPVFETGLKKFFHIYCVIYCVFSFMSISANKTTNNELIIIIIAHNST